MKIITFMNFFSDAKRNLKRNISMTIFSIITISAIFFILGIFLLYLLAVNKNSLVIFAGNRAMVRLLMWMSIAAFLALPPLIFTIIINAIKMNVFLRRNEISIMKFVGATDRFIRFPFIIEGLAIGITGAIIGVLLLFFVYSFIYSKAIGYAKEINLVHPIYIINIMLWVFGIIAAFISYIGSLISLRKILKLI